MLGNRWVIGKRRGHMFAQQRADRRCSARIWHEGHFDVGEAHKHFERDVRPGSGPDARHRHFARFGASLIKQVRKRSVGRPAANDNHSWSHRKGTNWLEAGLWIVIDPSKMRVDDEWRRGD